MTERHGQGRRQQLREGPPLRAILFDLDGTIIDSIPYILESYRIACEAIGCAVPDDAFLMSGIGLTLDAFMPRFVPSAQVADAIQAYRHYNNRNMASGIGLLLPAWRLLEALSAYDVPLGIVTAKGRDALELSLEPFDLAERFELLVSSHDTERHKPDPAPLAFALERLNAQREARGEAAIEASELLYVGDAIYDLQCAARFGCRAAAVDWSRMPHDELRAEKPDIWLRSIDDLSPYLLQP